MICWPWWLVAIAIVGATLLGIVLSFAWYWWLLSRPDRAG